MKKRLSKNVLQMIISAVFITTTFLMMFSLYRTNFVNVKYNDIPLRESASPFAKEEKTLTPNDEIQILKREHGWYQVLLDDKKTTGWVASWVLDGETQKVKNKTPLEEATIFLDAGHGGWDSGALHEEDTHNPVYFEKTYTLKYILALGKKLESAGARVIYTRTTDTYVRFQDVGEIANSKFADVFVSIHFDSSEDPGYTGVTQYYSQDNGSQQLAQAISNQFNNLGLVNKGVQQEDFAVVKKSSMPATLLEMGYINNDNDFYLIQQASYQKKTVNDIYKGLISYFDSRQK
ncbi:MAG: N-acetylmuramoyl-L-alanine amidase [Lactobacillaceae bacterium]|jgi:N-acetylmuramoyl-L-alanine amidase|nr:N-acetylmuramoyl-L-alanine amidase [Lactobacillaceae bacterium]